MSWTGLWHLYNLYNFFLAGVFLNTVMGVQISIPACFSLLRQLKQKTKDWGGQTADLFLTIMETEKSKIKVLTNLMSSENLLSGLKMATSSLCPHKAKREWELWSLFFFL